MQSHYKVHLQVVVLIMMLQQKAWVYTIFIYHVHTCSHLFTHEQVKPQRRISCHVMSFRWSGAGRIMHLVFRGPAGGQWLLWGGGGGGHLAYRLQRHIWTLSHCLPGLTYHHRDTWPLKLFKQSGEKSYQFHRCARDNYLHASVPVLI